MGVNEGEASLETQGAEAELALLEVEPGVAVLFGEAAPEGWDVEPFGLGDPSDREIIDALSNAVGAANAVAQGLGGLVSAQGLVRLSPETLRNLKTMQTMTKDGYYLGTLKEGGKFAASVRWAPAAGAQAASVLETLGPSLALLAISAQLTAISSKVDQNIELTRDVLKALREDHWNKLTGLYGVINGTIDEARKVGSVSPWIFRRVETHEVSIECERETFSNYLKNHLEKLDGAEYAERRTYLRDNGEAIIGDIQGFIMVEEACYRYQVLRAAAIAADKDRTDEDDRVMRDLAEEVPVRRRKAMERVARILRELDAHCHLADKLCGGKWSLRDFRSRRSGPASQVVGAMINYIDSVCDVFYEGPAELRPSIEVVKDAGGTWSDVLDILRWVLPREEPLLVLAEVSQSGFAKAIPGSDAVSGGTSGRLMGAASYLGITPTRFFLTSQSALTGDGSIERSVPLSELRYVRLREGKKRVIVDIITKDDNITVNFDGWAAEGVHRDEVCRVVNLLMSFVNLPEEERRSMPELQQIKTRRDLLEGETVA